MMYYQTTNNVLNLTLCSYIHKILSSWKYFEFFFLRLCLPPGPLCAVPFFSWDRKPFLPHANSVIDCQAYKNIFLQISQVLQLHRLLSVGWCSTCDLYNDCLVVRNDIAFIKTFFYKHYQLEQFSHLSCS